MGRHHYVLLRRRHDIPIRHREDEPLRRLGDVPLRCHWVFHLRCTYRVAGTYKETSLRRRHDVSLPGGRNSEIQGKLSRYGTQRYKYRFIIDSLLISS